MSSLPDLANTSALPDHDYWRIETRSDAHWAMQQVWEAQAVRKERTAEAQAVKARLLSQIALVDQWLADELREPDDRVAFFTGHLVRWMADLRRDNPKLKSVKLPYGTIKSRSVPAGIQIDDEKALVDTLLLQERKDLLATHYALDKTRIKTAVLTDGEVLPGVHRVDESLTFAVSIHEIGAPQTEVQHGS